MAAFNCFIQTDSPKEKLRDDDLNDALYESTAQYIQPKILPHIHLFSTFNPT